jgi:hypothetical protein
LSRIVVIGNSGGGKSTLARKLAVRKGLRYIEIDRLLWQDGWVPTPTDIYARQHREITEEEEWLIDGLGQQAPIPERLRRATEIVLIDLPLWVHFWLAAERQIAWARGTLEHAPAGIAEMPRTQGLFKTIWEVDQTWMPTVRVLCNEAATEGKLVTRLASVGEINAFAAI